MRTLPHRCIAASLIVVAALCAPTAGARAQTNSGPDQIDKPEVVGLTIRGVKKVSKQDLARSISTQASSCKSLLVRLFCMASQSSLWWNHHYFDDLEYQRDVLRIKVYYYKRGYRDTKVDTSVVRSGRGVKVAFDIDEGPPTLAQSLVVDSIIPPLTKGEVDYAMQIRAGQPLDLIAIDSSVVLLRNALWDKGYSDARINDSVVVDDSTRVGRVTIDVHPRWKAIVDTIMIEGNQRISERTIRNSLTFKSGDIYRRADVNESQRNLYQSNLFRRATITSTRGDSVKRITVAVVEAPLHEVTTSAGFNTIDFFQVEQRYTQYNFFGGARRLDLRGVIGNIGARPFNGRPPFQSLNLPDSELAPYVSPTWEATAELTQPWFRGPSNSLGLSLFSHRRSTPGIFVDQGYGASGSFTRQLGLRMPLTLNYRFEETKVTAGDVYFCQDYGVCDVATIRPLTQWRKLSPLSLDFTADRSDDPIDPRTGFIARADVEHANTYTASDYRYVRISAEYTKFLPVGQSMTLVGHTQAGWVRAIGSGGSAGLTPSQLDPLSSGTIIHPRKRFYAGGSQSVRGYGENQLGPRILTIDPTVLADSGCSVDPVAVRMTCPQGALDRISATSFQPRPLGGTALLEGNLELRFPLENIYHHLGGAVFLDGAYVGQGALQDVARGTGAITPGFGLRYYSTAGAIRVDLGIRPTLRENLNVVTEVKDANGVAHIVPVYSAVGDNALARKTYSPIASGSNFFSQILNRLTLHLSIGQAF